MKIDLTMPVYMRIGDDGGIYEVGTIEGSDEAEVTRALADLLDAMAGALRAGKRLPGQSRACIGDERARRRSR
jgi:hypothetical protein